VLVVDDQEQLRLLARTLIQDALVVRLSEAETASDAIALCCADHVDVLVLDMHMPGVDGMHVLGALNNLIDRPGIVAWSADELALRRARDNGADVAIDKMDVDGLAQGIRLCLQRQHQ
jgi:CheY-like chemotaxis protein